MAEDQENLRLAAKSLAEDVLATLKGSSADPEKIYGALQDLKIATVKKAAGLCGLDEKQEAVMDMLLSYAGKMPDFSVQAFSGQGLSWISLAMAVLTGWLIGGFCSGLLGFFAMGGDILRPLGIFAMISIEQYLAFNPAASKKFLKIFGWLGLAGFAARAGMGLLRFGTGLKNVLGKGTGFFKNIWLFIGMLLIMVFFSSKPARLDVDRLKTGLDKEILERLGFLCVVFDEWKETQARIGNLRAKLSENKTQAGGQILAEAVIQVLDDLDAPVRSFLLAKLAQDGFDVKAIQASGFVWNQEKHGALYEAQGFIKDGDHAIVLRKPLKRDGITVKGAVVRKG